GHEWLRFHRPHAGRSTATGDSIHSRHVTQLGGRQAARAGSRLARLHREERVQPGASVANHRAADGLAMGKIRVLVVEDSLTVRRRLVEVLNADPELQVAGEAAD